MKVPLKWLLEYVDIKLTPTEIAEQLTLAGNEVKAMKIMGADWSNVYVGQIVSVNPHPNADRLSLPTIDLATEQHTVVCGASNLVVGDKVAFARVGAKLFDGHTSQPIQLKSVKIRGVVSSGMVCSEKELGISDNHTEIMILPVDAPIGEPLTDYLGDVIFDLDITPNRPDCLSVIGLAREVSALSGQDMQLSSIEYEEEPSLIDNQVDVEISAPDLCPRYSASLINGVKVAPSPQWMQRRLLACGMRPINNVVDITNYVMLEYGQPLHAFDYEKIRGNKIIVRRAIKKERMFTLDNTERSLSEDMLVIADREGAIAIAGVMGGAESEVEVETTTILLEAASFKPASIHYTGRLLSLPSEACMRFERGISPELTIPALKRATQLMVQLTSGKAARSLIDVYPGLRKRGPISLSTGQVARILGVDFNIDQIKSALSSLGFKCQVASESKIQVTIPYWRSDIYQTYDLIEDIARIIGYDKIPAIMLSQPLPHQNTQPVFDIARKVRESLVGFGFQEVITYSLTSMEGMHRLLPRSHLLEPMPLRITNPMTLDQEYLRTNLRENLLAAVSENKKHEEEDIKLFELGKVYLRKGDDLPDEPIKVCGIMIGIPSEKSWCSRDESFDFYTAKGIVEGILARVGITINFGKSSDESLHPSKQASIVIGSSKLGVLGELHPKVAESFEISGEVCMFEINLSVLLPYTSSHKIFKPIPRFPAIVRDVALIVNEDITNQNVMDVIQNFSLVNRVTLFDVYNGKQIASGKKSLAYRMYFQSSTRTLTDKEVDKIQQKILKELFQELGATLRS